MTIINSKGENSENAIVGAPELCTDEGASAASVKEMPTERTADLSDKISAADSGIKNKIIGKPDSIEHLMPISDRAATHKKKSLFSEIKLAPRENDMPEEGENTEADTTTVGQIETESAESKKKVDLSSVKSMFEKVPFGKKNAIVVASLALICGALAVNYALTGGDSRSYYDYVGAGDSGDASLVGADTSADGSDTPVQGDGNTDAENVGADANAGDNAGDADATVSEQSGDAYFSAAAVERRRARDESIEVLQLVLDSEDALQESKDSALQSMAKIAEQIEQESNIESLIKAKGFEECIAVVGDEGATVIVSSDGLLANEVAQITEIMCEQTSLPASEINIVEK